MRMPSLASSRRPFSARVSATCPSPCLVKGCGSRGRDRQPTATPSNSGTFNPVVPATMLLSRPEPTFGPVVLDEIHSISFELAVDGQPAEFVSLDRSTIEAVLSADIRHSPGRIENADQFARVVQQALFNAGVAGVDVTSSANRFSSRKRSQVVAALRSPTSPFTSGQQFPDGTTRLTLDQAVGALGALSESISSSTSTLSHRTSTRSLRVFLRLRITLVRWLSAPNSPIKLQCTPRRHLPRSVQRHS